MIMWKRTGNIYYIFRLLSLCSVLTRHTARERYTKFDTHHLTQSSCKSRALLTDEIAFKVSFVKRYKKNGQIGGHVLKLCFRQQQAGQSMQMGTHPAVHRGEGEVPLLLTCWQCLEIVITGVITWWKLALICNIWWM